MRLLGLVLREAWYRRTSSLLALGAVAVAVALVNVFVLLGRASEAQTRMIQRDIGLNLSILPAATSLDRYWSEGYSEHTMPAEYIERVATQDVANRLIPLLRRRIDWNGTEVMLTGIAGETFAEGKAKKKAVFGMQIAPGQLVAGGTVAARLGLERGSEVELLGERFTVDRTLAELGGEEDVRVYVALADAQRLLGAGDVINEIQALECHCGDDVEDPLEHLRTTLEPLLPGTRIVRRANLADARRRQRLLAERFLAVTAPVVVVLCGLWVAALAAINARERRRELGVLWAIGYGAGTVTAALLARAVLFGAFGAVIGTWAGTALASELGPSIFGVARSAIVADPSLYFWGLVLAPAFAAFASLVPTLVAATQDPADVLRHA